MKVDRVFNSGLPSSYSSCAGAQDPANGNVSFQSVKPPGGDYKGVAAGTYDATIRSLAFAPATADKYARDEFIPGNCDGIQSVMCNYSYYFGIGWTRMAHFDLAYKGLSVGADAEKTTLSSIEGRSRFGESQRLNATDSSSKVGAWVAYEISSDLRVELGVERRAHVSQFGGKTVTAREAITRGRLIYKLD